MKSRWITHREKRIFISDFSNYGNDALAVREECEAIRLILQDEPVKSVLAIVDVDGTFVNEGIVREFRQILPVTNKYVKRRAVVGLNGFRRHFLFLVAKFTGGINFSPFDNLDDALSWIVQE